MNGFLLASQQMFIKRCIFFLLLASAYMALNSASGQSPYRLTWKKESAWLISSSALVGAGRYSHNQLEPVSLQETSTLDKNEVFVLDRWVLNQHSQAANLRSDIGAYSPIVLTAGAIAGLPLMNREKGSFWSQAFTMGSMWFEANALNLGTTELMKSSIKRLRPYAYRASSDNPLDVDTRKSFPSGHTSVSATNAFFTAALFADYYPNSKWKPAIWTLASIIPAWTGIERILAGKHFPTDVMAGYAIGAAIGLAIPRLHKIKEDAGLSVNKTKSASMRWYPIASAGGIGFHWSVHF